MSMFGPKIGTWQVHSEIDSRWNNSGRGYGLVSTCGTQDLKDWLAECRKLYGDPPKDCTHSFHKD